MKHNNNFLTPDVIERIEQALNDYVSGVGVAAILTDYNIKREVLWSGFLNALRSFGADIPKTRMLGLNREEAKAVSEFLRERRAAKLKSVA